MRDGFYFHENYRFLDRSLNAVKWSNKYLVFQIFQQIEKCSKGVYFPTYTHAHVAVAKKEEQKHLHADNVLSVKFFKCQKYLKEKYFGMARPETRDPIKRKRAL